MLEITEYAVSYEIRNPLIFNTYPGFNIRNAIIKALSHNCVNPERKSEHKIISCTGCPYQQGCGYSALKLPVSQHVSSPVPLSFSLDADALISGKYVSGILEFKIALFGYANSYFPLFELAFREIGEVFGLGDNGVTGNVRLLAVEKTDDKSCFISTATQKPGKSFLVKFKHLRLAENMMNATFQLSFPLLLRLISSRLNELEAIYGQGAENKLTGHDTVPAHNTILDCKSQFAKCNYKYAGTNFGYYFLSGQSRFSGDYSPWYRIIEMGRQTGVGRFTSYGFGRYEVDYQ